jgi:hypothetical protein
VSADARDHVDGDRLFGIDEQAGANRDDRIQHRPLRAGERGHLHHRPRGSGGSRAADEPQAIGLEGRLIDVGAVYRHQVKHPGRLLVDRARPAGAQDGAPLAQDLGLDEEIAEGRVQGFGGGRSDHDVGVAGDIDLAALPRAIGDADPAQLDVVLR